MSLLQKGIAKNSSVKVADPVFYIDTFQRIAYKNPVSNNLTGKRQIIWRRDFVYFEEFSYVLADNRTLDNTI